MCSSNPNEDMKYRGPNIPRASIPTPFVLEFSSTLYRTVRVGRTDRHGARDLDTSIATRTGH